jgi:hypothetical protein
VDAAGAAPTHATGPRWRTRLRAARDQAIAPILARLGVIETRFDGVDRRLDALARRMDDIDSFVQMLEARVSTASERAAMHAESEARLRRRLDEIALSLGGEPERLLGPAD